jgi:hypothetical protein
MLPSLAEERFRAPTSYKLNLEAYGKFEEPAGGGR